MQIFKKLSYCAAFSPLIFISACSNNVPSCSDPEVNDLALQITRDEINRQYGQQTANETPLSLNAIRTTNQNETTGAFECAAELSINQQKFPITYTVEITDDQRVYVTVFGL